MIKQSDKQLEKGRVYCDSQLHTILVKKSRKQGFEADGQIVTNSAAQFPFSFLNEPG